MPTTRAARRAGSACTGTSRSRSPARSSPRRRSPAYTASARRWPPRAGRSTGSATPSSAAPSRPSAARGGRDDPAGADGRRLPPVPGRRALADLGPDATGAFVGLTLAHGRGHLVRAILEASALAIRHVADADARGRRPRHRDAGLRRTGPERDVEPDQGRRDGLPVLVPGGARDGGPGLGDPRRGRHRRVPATSRPRCGR